MDVKLTLYKSNHFKVKDLVALSTFRMLCNHHLRLVSEPSHPTKGDPNPLSSHTPSPSPRPWHQVHFLSVDLPVLDISYKWNHTLCVLLCLVSLTEHRVDLESI